MEIPVKISQTWRQTYKNGKWKSTPIVKSKQTRFESMKSVKKEVWIEFIEKGWLPVNNDLRKWLNENGHENIIKKKP